MNRDHLPGASWRKVFWDLGAPIVWLTDVGGTVVVSEGGGLRGIGRTYADNVGVNLSAFGPDSEVWTVAYPAAMAGETTITPSSFDGVAFINLCGPIYDGRGRVSGMFGFSWTVTDATYDQLVSTVTAIGNMLGVVYAT